MIERLCIESQMQLDTINFPKEGAHGIVSFSYSFQINICNVQVHNCLSL